MSSDPDKNFRLNDFRNHKRNNGPKNISLKVQIQPGDYFCKTINRVATMYMYISACHSNKTGHLTTFLTLGKPGVREIRKKM